MLKLGEKIIKDIYLGDKKIAKVFWGDKLVYQSGKPIFLDYVRFDGASWIDTGIKHQTCTVECDIRFEETGKRQLMGFGTGGGQYWGAGTTGTFDYMSGTNALDRTDVVIDFNAEEINYKIYADGKSRTSESGKALSSFTYRIGANPTGVSSSGYWCTCEVWSNKFKVNGELIQDLRPCIDPNGTVCFYDMVTKKYFYNKGTGTLKAGGRFVKSILFDGASYIDTGIAHQTCTVECDIRFENTGTRQLMGFGSGTGQFWGAGATGIFDYMSGTNALDRTLVVINYNATEKTVTVNADGKTRTGSKGSGLSSHSYKIGTAPTGATSGLYWCTGEVWGNKFTVNGELIQDLRPYVDENNVACFKDVVTGNLFYNKGTGTLGYTEE